MRLVRRSFQNLILISCVLVMLITIYFLSQHQEEDVDRSVQIEIIERSIKSAVNRGECHQPDLPLDSPDIMRFYKPVGKVYCGTELDWVMCEKSICFVKPEITAIYSDITCSYTDIIRKSDTKLSFGRTTKTKEPYILQKSDFVKVSCIAESGDRWFGMAYGIRDNVQPLLAPNLIPNLAVMPPEAVAQARQQLQDGATSPYYNILMFGFDSLSRAAYMRKLPRTYNYLTRELGGVVLKGYNIVGDGTPQALLPILTGYTELELPETRKRKPGSVSVDVYPMIWQDFARLGYVTSFNEDLPNVGTFTLRLNGFNAQPTDHYLRTFYMQAQNILSSSLSNCVGNKPDHLVMLEYTTNFMLKYRDTPRFVFSFHGGLSHDSINLIGAADDDMYNWLVKLKERSLLNDTILILMADHGNRFADVRSTLQGKQEERLPFFSFVFPESFKKRFPQEYKNFVANEHRLTTPFDIYATFNHIMKLQKTGIKEPTSENNDDSTTNDLNMESTQPKNIQISEFSQTRAISLLDPIPSNRSCADAYIAPHWCACLNWMPLDLTDLQYEGIILKAAKSIVDTINAATAERRQICATLQIMKVNWATRLQPRKELLKFNHNSDVDGFLADLNGQTIVHEEIFQLQIVTEPGQGLYEASISRNVHTFDFTTKLSDISRVNQYGNQARCIYERDPELRKFCYCRD